MNLSTEPTTNLSINTTVVLPPLIYFNNIYADKLLPLTIVLWVYLTVGVLGNSLVMFVYWARKKPVREDRYFIPILALVDMSSCVVSSSTGIYAQTYPLMFDNDVGCRMAAFLGILFANVSADFLLAIAVERYIKLCRPFGRQMTMFQKKIIIFAICLFGLVLSFPALAVYMSEQYSLLKAGSLKAWKCSDTKSTEFATGHMIYKILLFTITIIRFLVLIMCYGNIIFVIFKHSKHRQRLGSIISCTSTAVSFSDDGGKTIEMDKANPNDSKSEDDVKETKEMGSIKKLSVGKKLTKGSIADRKFSKRKLSVASMTGSIGKRGSVADRQGVRLGVIFSLIALFYIITYAPKVWLMIEQSLDRDFWVTVPPSRLMFYRFLHTFYIFNNIVNPIVYGIMDKRFKADCKKRFTKCR